MLVEKLIVSLALLAGASVARAGDPVACPAFGGARASAFRETLIGQIRARARDAGEIADSLIQELERSLADDEGPAAGRIRGAEVAPAFGTGTMRVLREVFSDGPRPAGSMPWSELIERAERTLRLDPYMQWLQRSVLIDPVGYLLESAAPATALPLPLPVAILGLRAVMDPTVTLGFRNAVANLDRYAQSVVLLNELAQALEGIPLDDWGAAANLEDVERLRDQMLGQVRQAAAPRFPRSVYAELKRMRAEGELDFGFLRDYAEDAAGLATPGLFFERRDPASVAAIVARIRREIGLVDRLPIDRDFYRALQAIESGHDYDRLLLDVFYSGAAGAGAGAVETSARVARIQRVIDASVALRDQRNLEDFLFTSVHPERVARVTNLLRAMAAP